MKPMFDELNALLGDIAIPPVVKVRQDFPDLQLPDVGGTLVKLLRDRNPDIKPGQRIAITCGSRGVDNYPLLVKTIVDYVKSRQASPVLIPAMGSHGGATAEGQIEVLRLYGITEEAMGAPVISSMEVVELGLSERGLPAYTDKNAYACDGVILLNRIKMHTGFRGKIESGLIKMASIGLGKQKGCDMIHFSGFDEMGENILAVGKLVFDKLNIICGVGLVEDSFGHTAEVRVLSRDEIFEKEPELLERSKDLMPQLYIDQADVLIAQLMGKNIAGSGLDSNILGRYNVKKPLGGPNFDIMGVLDLSDESEGNAMGMGMAEFATRRLYQKIDFIKGYTNAISATAVYSNRMPMILDSDKLVVQATIKFACRTDRMQTSMVYIYNTKQIEEIFMTRAALDLIPEKYRSRIEVLGDFQPVPFDEAGNLRLFV